MKFLLAIALLLSIVCMISCATQSITLATSSSSDVCIRTLAKTKFNTDPFLFYANRFAATTTFTNVKSAELWVCDDDTSTFTEGEAACGSNGPNTELCQMIFKTEGSSLVNLPTNVYFLFSESGYNKLVTVLRSNGGAMAVGSGITMEGSLTAVASAVEAGVSTFGVSNAKLSVPTTASVGAAYTVSSICENECATQTAWNIFAAQALTPQTLATVSAQFYDNGVSNSTSFYSSTTGATRNTTLFTNVGLNDAISTSYTFNTAATELSGSDSDTATTASAKLYVNYYPKSAGINRCLDSACLNRAAVPDYKTNTLINYIAILATGIVIGIIIGLAIYYLFNIVKGWIEENSFRFQKKYIKSFFNPIWWFKSKEDIEPEEVDEEDILGDLKNENEAAAQEDPEEEEEAVEETKGENETPDASEKDHDDHPDVPLVANV